MTKRADGKTIVEVVWEDSAAKDGWQITDDVDSLIPWTIRSVGYLAAEEKGYVRLVEAIATTTGEGTGKAKDRGCAIAIRKSAVRAIRVLGRTRH